MELMYRRCCGLDVHKETVVACLPLSPMARSQPKCGPGGPSALVEVAGGKRVHACGDGSNRRLLEAGLARQNPVRLRKHQASDPAPIVLSEPQRAVRPSRDAVGSATVRRDLEFGD